MQTFGYFCRNLNRTQMFKPVYFLLASILFLGFFTQCQDATATKENVTEAAKEVVQQPVEKVKEVAESVDSSLQLKAKAIAAVTPVVKEKEPAKEVKSTTTKAADRKKEPATAPKKVKKRSKIKFKETTHKFGTIKTGDKISHKFKFTNTGNAPLVIKNVDVSCGCTFPSYPFLPIKPGEEGEIDVTFNSEHKIGRQKPTVTVVTNGRPRKLKLYMEGFVE